jgi:hypothetical protein
LRRTERHDYSVLTGIFIYLNGFFYRPAERSKMVRAHKWQKICAESENALVEIRNFGQNSQGPATEKAHLPISIRVLGADRCRDAKPLMTAGYGRHIIKGRSN